MKKGVRRLVQCLYSYSRIETCLSSQVVCGLLLVVIMQPQGMGAPVYRVISCTCHFSVSHTISRLTNAAILL